MVSWHNRSLVRSIGIRARESVSWLVAEAPKDPHRCGRRLHSIHQVIVKWKHNPKDGTYRKTLFLKPENVQSFQSYCLHLPSFFFTSESLSSRAKVHLGTGHTSHAVRNKPSGQMEASFRNLQNLFNFVSSKDPTWTHCTIFLTFERLLRSAENAALLKLHRSRICRLCPKHSPGARTLQG